MTTISKKTTSLQILLLLAATALSIEFLLSHLKKSSLCSTSACKMAGEYIQFGEAFLFLLGGIFFWLLLLTSFLYTRYPKKHIWYTIQLGLLCALAFDGALLGYQLLGLNIYCLLCIIVAIVLFAALVLLSWSAKNYLILLLGLAVWIGGFSANSLLLVKAHTPDLSETAFIHKPARLDAPKYTCYLFFSFHCSHCSQVLANIALNKPWNAEWHICSVDQRKQDLYKLARALKDPVSSQNPFLTLLMLKQEKGESKAVTIPPELEEQVKKARIYISNTGFSGIPLLIVKQGVGKQIILQGANSIAKFLWETGMIEKWILPQKIEPKKE